MSCVTTGKENMFRAVPGCDRRTKSLSKLGDNTTW